MRTQPDLEKRNKVLEMWQTSSKPNMAEIGRSFGLTRERIRQILNDAKVAKPDESICLHCKRKFKPTRLGQRYCKDRYCSAYFHCEQRKQNNFRVAICKNKKCQKEFTTTNNTKQTCCQKCSDTVRNCQMLERKRKSKEVRLVICKNEKCRKEFTTTSSIKQTCCRRCSIIIDHLQFYEKKRIKNGNII